MRSRLCRSGCATKLCTTLCYLRILEGILSQFSKFTPNSLVEDIRLSMLLVGAACDDDEHAREALAWNRSSAYPGRAVQPVADTRLLCPFPQR